MADERAVLLGRAVSSSACRLGVALKDRRPAAGNVADLCHLASQCLELAGVLDGNDAEGWAELVAATAERARPAQAAVQPGKVRQRISAA